MEEADFIEVWRHARLNHREIRNSNSCRCLLCRERFAPADIERWYVRDGGQRVLEQNPIKKRAAAKVATAICPHCDGDAIVGDASGYPLNDSNFIGQVFAVGPRYFFDAQD